MIEPINHKSRDDNHILDFPLTRINRFSPLWDGIDIFRYPKLSYYYSRVNNEFKIEENDKEVQIIGNLPIDFNKDMIKVDLEKTNDNYYNLNINIKHYKEEKDSYGRIIRKYQSTVKKSYPLVRDNFNFDSMKAFIKDGKLYIQIPKQEKINEVESLECYEHSQNQKESNQEEKENEEDIAIVTDVNDDK